MDETVDNGAVDISTDLQKAAFAKPDHMLLTVDPVTKELIHLTLEQVSSLFGMEETTFSDDSIFEV